MWNLLADRKTISVRPFFFIFSNLWMWSYMWFCVRIAIFFFSILKAFEVCIMLTACIPFGNHCFQIGNHYFISSSRLPEKGPILNLNNIFLDILKKFWTVKSLEIYSSLASKTLVKIRKKLWYIFSVFWEYYKNDKMIPGRISIYY